MISAIGIDAAFANMGFARVLLYPGTPVPGLPVHIDCLDLHLVSTGGQDRKVVRKSSDDLRRAIELRMALSSYIGDASVAFAEIPSGAQSAAAAKALGMAIGVLASCSIPIIEVSPMEVKEAVTGSRKKSASKTDVIDWAVMRWPMAPWVRHTRNGKGFVIGDLQNCNEHLADALATVAAGVKTPEFKRLLAMTHHATTSTPNFRPASNRVPFD